MEVTDLSEGATGGYKEIVFSVKGEGSVWYPGNMRAVRTASSAYLRPSHRGAYIPRQPPWPCPAEEGTGRSTGIHRDADVLLGRCRRSDVNKVETKAQSTHKPTGMVAVCQQAHSQIANRELARKCCAQAYDIEASPGITKLLRSTQDDGIDRRPFGQDSYHNYP